MHTLSGITALIGTTFSPKHRNVTKGLSNTVKFFFIKVQKKTTGSKFKKGTLYTHAHCQPGSLKQKIMAPSQLKLIAAVSCRNVQHF